jgi:hypothetical protein
MSTTEPVSSLSLCSDNSGTCYAYVHHALSRCFYEQAETLVAKVLAPPSIMISSLSYSPGSYPAVPRFCL